MADTKISALTAAASAAGANEIPINEAGTTKKVTITQIAAFLASLTQTLTNKTLTAPIISTISNTGTLTLPTSTDTLVGKATTDTFTNKTFDTAGTGNVFKINGTAVSAVTGTGSNVLATSPTLVTPLLGTPTSGTLTNCTGHLYGNLAMSTTGGFTAIYFGLTGVNFNSANTDNNIPITLPSGFTRFQVAAVRIWGASQTLTTATCGVFTSTGGGGTAVVASGSAITVSTASEGTNNNTMLLTVVNANTTTYLQATVPILYFRVQNAQGAPATGNVMIVINPLA